MMKKEKNNNNFHIHRRPWEANEITKTTTNIIISSTFIYVRDFLLQMNVWRLSAMDAMRRRIIV